MTTRRKARRWPWLVSALGLAGAGVFLAQRGSADPQPLDEALILTVKRATLAIDILETGKVLPREKVEIKSKVAGQVTEVRVKEGERITKGTLLVVLDPTDYQREVARADAAIAQAKNALALASITLERKSLGAQSSITPQLELDAAKFDFTTKTIALRTADIAQKTAQDQVRYTKILSPLDGTVIHRGIEPGEVVVPGVQSTFEGKSLLTIADLSVLVAKVDLNQIDVARVRLGQSAVLTLDALPGKSYAAKITKIAPASVRPPGKDLDVFPIEAELTVVDALIKPGMTADVRIHLDSRENTLFLSLESIVKESGKSFVTRVITDPAGHQKTEKIEVTVGVRNDREVEITAGIQENDRILINPGSASANETKM